MAAEMGKVVVKIEPRVVLPRWRTWMRRAGMVVLAANAVVHPSLLNAGLVVLFLEAVV